MRALSANDLLGAWETGADQSPPRRVLALLAAASPDVAPDQLAELSIGERDARLLALREQMFGPRLECVARCPGCGGALEFGFDISDMRAQPVRQDDALTVALADYEVSFRLPNTLDLLAIEPGSDAAVAQLLLLQRCVVTARRHGETCAADSLPAEIVESVAAQMARADPLADARFALSCLECGHRWEAVFDIGSFLWAEISAWVSRILREVHVLASAYGWPEADILAMSARRRHSYLDMVGA